MNLQMAVFKEWLWRLVAFETLDQSDEETWPDQQKDKDKDKEWWGDMTWPKLTITMTFREHPQRAILETCDLWDIWSEWWGDMTWPKKRQRQWQIQRQRQWQRQIHLESTFKERS